VPTPGQKTIAEITAFLGAPATHQIKSLVYVVDGSPHLFLVRGDHQLNEAKALAAAGGVECRPALPEEIRQAFGADAGSLGPVGVTHLPVIADRALEGRVNMTCGANRDDHHLQGVTPGVDFAPTWADLRAVEAGEACARCGAPLDVFKAVEVGHIFKLGTKYSVSMGATVQNADGDDVPLVMGSYGIGIGRILAAAVELYHDADGIAWPAAIAPFEVVITPVQYRDETRAAADRLYAELRTAGVDVLLDDRDERPGVKFKDADLIGIPFRIVLGAQKVARGEAELYTRAGRRTEVVALGEVAAELRARLAQA
jgi:prolyl-tRNA synthetase